MGLALAQLPEAIQLSIAGFCPVSDRGSWRASSSWASQVVAGCAAEELQDPELTTAENMSWLPGRAQCWLRFMHACGAPPHPHQLALWAGRLELRVLPKGEGNGATFARTVAVTASVPRDAWFASALLAWPRVRPNDTHLLHCCSMLQLRNDLPYLAAPLRPTYGSKLVSRKLRDMAKYLQACHLVGVLPTDSFGESHPTVVISAHQLLRFMAAGGIVINTPADDGGASDDDSTDSDEEEVVEDIKKRQSRLWALVPVARVCEVAGQRAPDLADSPTGDWWKYCDHGALSQLGGVATEMTRERGAVTSDSNSPTRNDRERNPADHAAHAAAEETFEDQFAGAVFRDVN